MIAEQVQFLGGRPPESHSADAEHSSTVFWPLTGRSSSGGSRRLSAGTRPRPCRGSSGAVAPPSCIGFTNPERTGP